MAESDPRLPQDQTKSTDKEDAVRQVLGDTYSFVRSREINAAISAFTFDHYIDEAKRRIKSDRTIVDASGKPVDGLRARPSQLDALANLKQAFQDGFEDAKKLADAADSDAADVKAAEKQDQQNSGGA